MEFPHVSTAEPRKNVYILRNIDHQISPEWTANALAKEKYTVKNCLASFFR